MAEYTVDTREAAPLTLNEADRVTSILQNVRIILTTRRGSVPMARGFGLSQDFIDKPVNVAETMMFAAVKEAIEEFEPRASLVDLTFLADEAVPGKLYPVVRLEISDEEY